MAQQYPKNELYQKMLDVSQSLGKSIRESKLKNPTAGISEIPQYQNLPKSLAGLGGRVSTPYMGSTKYEPGGTHKGLDIAISEGTKIPSFTEGQVTEVVTGKGWTPDTPSYGNYVIVQTPQGDKMRYSHLSNSFVKVGQKINKGDVLALSGGTGSTYSVSNPGSPGYHLDLRIQDAYNNYVSPISYLSNY